MQLRDLLLILRQRWTTVVASALLVLAATAAVTWTTTPIYTASAQVYLSALDRTPEEGGAPSVYAITRDDLNTYVAVMGSPEVQDPLRERLGLAPGTPIDVTAEVAQTSPILAITARSSDPQLAADIANATGPQLAEVATTFSPLLRAAGQEVGATTISPASPPGAPTSPNVSRNLALGLLTGLVLGVGLALVRHTADTRVRSDADIKALSTSPMLGHLPVVKTAEGESRLHFETDPRSPYAEAIRRLRTNLMFVDVTTGRHAFVVTSAMPSDGKTVTSVNLGLAIADAGTRVLLVDADLRNPSVAKTMGIDGSVGLTTVLLGRVAAEDVVQQWRDTNLFVLPAGQIPPNPSELLGSEPMEELFSKLLHDYEFIIVDSPPVVPVIDAVVLERYTGGILMVVGADRTRKRDLSHALKSLETVKAKVAGFAINTVPVKSADLYHYGYRYGGRYGSHYGDKAGGTATTGSSEHGGSRKSRGRARGKVAASVRPDARADAESNAGDTAPAKPTKRGRRTPSQRD